MPEASHSVSNLALTSFGGGMAPLDPQKSDKPQTLDTWFEFELGVPTKRSAVLGAHAYVRFEHAPEPLAWRIYRSIRQLFLRQFTL